MREDSHDDLDVHEDYAEYVDHDRHEEAASYEGPKSTREDEAHEEEIYDEYHYGEESGEDYESAE